MQIIIQTDQTIKYNVIRNDCFVINWANNFLQLFARNNHHKSQCKHYIKSDLNFKASGDHNFL